MYGCTSTSSFAIFQSIKKSRRFKKQIPLPIQVHRQGPGHVWPGEEDLAQPDRHLQPNMVRPFSVDWIGGAPPPAPVKQKSKHVLRMPATPPWHDSNWNLYCSPRHYQKSEGIANQAHAYHKLPLPAPVPTVLCCLVVPAHWTCLGLVKPNCWARGQVWP